MQDSVIHALEMLLDFRKAKKYSASGWCFLTLCENLATCRVHGSRFIHRRHDEIRDLLAAAMSDVAYDVSTDPAPAPLTGEVLPPSANLAA